MADNKQDLLAKLEATKAHAEGTQRSLVDLSAALEVAREDARKATEAHEAAYDEAHADEIAAARTNAETNERRHHEECAKQQAKLDARKAKRLSLTGRMLEFPNNVEPIDHAAIKTIAIDGAVHEVVAAHGLFVGSHGIGIRQQEPREGSRYTVACGLSCDTPHDELHHERFDTAAVDCKSCKAALVDMNSGAIPDRRSDYLTSEEQLAHARAQQAARNQASSGPAFEKQVP